jgi:hypothetical protein
MGTSVRTPTTIAFLFPLLAQVLDIVFVTGFVVAVLQMLMHALRACLLPLPALAVWGKAAVRQSRNGDGYV